MTITGWKDTTVLVTGAGGFIGSHLVQTLVAEHARVRALVRYNGRDDWGMLEEIERDRRREVDVRVGDIRDPYLVDHLVDGCDVVLHLAALIGIPYSYVAPSEYVATNVAGTLHVLEACRRRGVRRVVHTSTSETYGTARYVPIDEAHPLQGQSPYSASKIGADAIAESYHRAFGVSVATVRPFNTYGPRQSARAVIPTILAQLYADGDVRVGSLHPVRDLTYVDDTVQGILAVAAADAAVGRVVNLGTGSGISIGDLARLAMTVTGIEKPLVCDEERVRPAASEVDRLVSAPGLARELTGWEAKVGLEEGVRRTAEYVQAHLARFKAGRYVV